MRKRLLQIGAALAVLTLLIAAPSLARTDAGQQENSKLPNQAKQFAEIAEANTLERGRQLPQGFDPCVGGMAADTYPCHRVDLLGHVPLEDLGLSFANDMWGWTDPATGKDYAIVGGIEGTAFVDISDPTNPDVVGLLPTHSSEGNEFWRDIKVYADHVFVVSEHTEHGMQVFDLTQLRGVTGDPVMFAETAHYAGFSNTHNLNINTDTGFAYAVGTNSCDAGLHMVDISDPTAPTFAGCFSDHGYIHDTQCVIYRGPDAEHQGREICFNSAATFLDFSPEGIINTVSIVDVTDKRNPVALSRVEYVRDGYSHQGWLTQDQSHFLHGDELDEVFRGVNTTTRIWDVRDLERPKVSGAFKNNTTSIDHNIYTEGRFAYASNYTSGLRVYDTRNVPAGQLSEAAFFDVYPENDNASFEGGTWSNYAFFAQNQVVGVSSMDRGLFVLRPHVGR